uniref:RNA 3'-terminal phosphate cyclase n=2 Tax=Mesocestoides corti TaxID=53468 RepID=A0A5K3F3Q4_MESCO
MNTVLIDGSNLEGGGQILRNAVSFSAICQSNVEVNSIRAGRPNPGLSNQHMFGLELAAKLCDAELLGCCPKSKEIVFRPGAIKGGVYQCDVKTAGSVSLLMQISVPILAFAKSKSSVTLHGGTDASFAPPIDYMVEVTAFYYEKFGINFRTQVLERGYYPQGGGTVVVDVDPICGKLSPVCLTEMGSIVKVTGSTFVAGKVPIKVADEMRSVGLETLRSHFPDVPIEVESFRAPDNSRHGSVSSFLFIAETSTGCRLAVSGLGQPRGPPVRQLVKEAIEQELIPCIKSGVCCDTHMQDQLILPMALAQGKSVIRTTTPLTLHTQSAIYVAEKILPSVKFHLEDIPGQEASLLFCTGIGAENVL